MAKSYYNLTDAIDGRPLGLLLSEAPLSKEIQDYLKGVLVDAREICAQGDMHTYSDTLSLKKWLRRH